MLITITGSSGFVGNNLINYLENEFEIEIISARYIIGQTFNLKSNTIIHLSGKAHDLKNVASPKDYYDANFELTKQLYDAFLISSAKTFIYMSSVKAAADVFSGSLDENVQPDPRTHYGKSKLMAEEYIQSKTLPAGKSYYILRPCMIHGPGNKGNLNLLYKLVKMKMPYPLAAFDNERSFLSIENLSFIIKEIILQANIPSGVYHVADDDTLSTNQVINILSGSLNRKAWLLRINPAFIKLIAKIGDRLHLPLTTERLGKLTESYVVNNSKLKKAINKPLPLSSRVGLKITALSFQNL